jgi:UPF0042 nucleotide-binding protein
VEPHRIVLVSGMSGSGKSTAIRALEDSGWFCIDNLPVVLLPKLLELVGHGAGDEMPRLALVVDARESRFLDATPASVAEVRRLGHEVEVVFLECSDDSLLRRFSETRRRHPLSPDGSVAEGIAHERRLLEGLRAIATQVIDTTRMTVHELREVFTTRFGGLRADSLNVTLVSFGYRNGLPQNSDLVFDLRFLPNPYFVDGLKPLPGTDPRVSQWVLSRPEAQEFLDRLHSLIAYLLPRYRAEGKSYLTIALGCTGGRHRSVALAEELAARLRHTEARVQVVHRDVERS